MTAPRAPPTAPPMIPPRWDEEGADELVGLGGVPVFVEDDTVAPPEGAEVGGGTENTSVSVTGVVALAPTPCRTNEGKNYVGRERRDRFDGGRPYDWCSAHSFRRTLKFTIIILRRWVYGSRDLIEKQFE